MEIAERSRQDFAEEHVEEVRQGRRFEFGDNWYRFLQNLKEEQIVSAETSLREMLEISDLTGKKFLDAGSGSGLFSLAARRLGAQVHSFDYDPQSVACTKELRRRYSQNDPWWRIEHQSVLDTRLSLLPWSVRCGVFVGRASPYGCDVEGIGQRAPLGRERRAAVYRDL